MLSPAEDGGMSRSVPFSAGLLVGVCVFAWLAGPVLAARFGAEALLAAYGAVAAGAAGTTYVVTRRIDGYLSRSTRRKTDRTAVGANPNRERRGPAGDATVGLDDLDVEREVNQLKAERSRPAGED